jgi:PAS domain S-box-containing protein
MSVPEPDPVERLRATLRQLENACEELGDAMARVDRLGTVRWCNKAFEQLLGQPPDKIRGARLIELLPLEPMGQAMLEGRDPVDLVLSGQSGVTGLYKLRAQNQESLLELSSVGLRLDPEYTGALFVIRDVTPRNHRAEAELRTANQLLETKIEELEFMNRVMMAREERILELKTELKALRNQLGPKGVDGAGPLPAAGPS